MRPPTGPPKPENYATIGTSAMILKMAKTPDNRTQLLVQGLGRFRIKQLSQAEGKPFWQAAVEHLTETTERDTEIEALMANIVNLFARIVQHSPTLPPEVVYMAQSIKEPGTLADMIASSLNATAEEKQKVLEILPVGERLKEVTRIVNKQLEILELGKKIQDQVKGDMDKKQREYYLREQLKAIKTELGDKDERHGRARGVPHQDQGEGPAARGRPRRPSASWSGWRACTPPRRSTRWRPPSSTG